jgi:hypothetical protein
MKQFTIIIFLLMLTACSSMGEKVLVRMDEADSKPKWATLSKTMYVSKGNIYAVGFVEVPAGSRISAAAKIADNNARLEIGRQVTNDMAFIFQNMEEGIGEGGQLARFYGSEVSKHMSHGIQTEKRYWEKVQSFDEDGEKTYKLRLYSLIFIKQSNMKKAITRALAKDNGLTPKIKEEIDNHIMREINKLGNDS